MGCPHLPGTRLYITGARGGLITLTLRTPTHDLCGSGTVEEETHLHAQRAQLD